MEFTVDGGVLGLCAVRSPVYRSIYQPDRCFYCECIYRSTDLNVQPVTY